jgi:hypothetical protein
MDRLDRDAIDRLIKLLGMLGSIHAGERAAAGLKAHELIKRHGLQWGDIVVSRPAPSKIGWRDKAYACASHLHLLNATERAFVRTMSTWRGIPSDKQLSWLNRIYENLP